MHKEELEYQISKALEYIERGGDFEKWLESKDFIQIEANCIKNHPKIIEKLEKKI